MVSPALQYMCTKKEFTEADFVALRAWGPELAGEWQGTMLTADI